MKPKQLLVIDQNPETLANISAEGLAQTCIPSIDAGAMDTDLVLVSLPLLALPKTFETLAHHAHHRTTPLIVSDVTGIKVPVSAWAQEFFTNKPIHYIGAHPMIGGVKGGFIHADGSLFVNATVAVCTEDNSNEDAVGSIIRLWKTLGATVVRLSAAEHDAQVAHTSHLPYLSSVAQILSFDDHGLDATLMGKSFADVTRRAAFDPEIMATIAAHNPFLRRAILGVADQLHRLADALPHGDTKMLDDQNEEVIRAAAERARAVHKKLFG